MLSFHWSYFAPFFSVKDTLDFLKQHYERNGIPQAGQHAYENCYPFIYYLEHGKVYYEQAEKSPFILKPILLFYGMTHLIKACILTVDPFYPETTSVLAHGVSARKRKKQQYQFFHDEVKFQKSGLFPFMANKLFQIKCFENPKVSMGQLLKQIPELDSLFFQLEGANTFLPIKMDNSKLSIPCGILDRYHMTEERFASFLLSKLNVQINFHGTENNNLIFSYENGVNPIRPPLKVNIREGTPCLPLIKDDTYMLDEILIHFLLLYNLSMIARYETEWWGELVKMMPNKDFPFIQTFMDITLDKGPYLIYQILLKNKE